MLINLRHVEIVELEVAQCHVDVQRQKFPAVRKTHDAQTRTQANVSGLTLLAKEP